MSSLSEQEIIRRDKLKELQSLGIDPYPAALYPVNTTALLIKEHYKGEENKADFAGVCLAGRVMGIRDMGKASFAVLQDSTGKIQVYIRRDDICPTEDKSPIQTKIKDCKIINSKTATYSSRKYTSIPIPTSLRKKWQ